MKKVLALVLALVMVFALAACGEPSKPQDTSVPEETGTPAPEKTDAPEMAYKVAMVTDYGDINDQSFNQNTYEGCKAFCEANGVDFKYYKPAGDSTAERVAMVDAAVAEGYNIIVMPGFAFAGTIHDVQDQYADVKFVALDVSEFDLEDSFYNHDENMARTDLIDPANEPHVGNNVYCCVYKEELCGYMAGYAAVKLGYKHLGFMGGMAVPAVVRYGYGFVQGADAAAAEMGLTDVVLDYAYANQFFGDADITAYCDTWYQTKGVEVIFACGGGVYTSVAEAAAKAGAKVIGVDVDQSAVIDAYGEGMTVTSAMKGLAAAVQATLGDVILNNNWAAYGGKIATLGLVSGEDPTLNYVQIPYETTQWSEAFTQEDYVALVAKMVDGTIVVSDDISADPAVTAITFENSGNVK